MLIDTYILTPIHTYREQSLATNTIRSIKGLGKVKLRDENGKKLMKPSVKAKKTKKKGRKL